MKHDFSFRSISKFPEKVELLNRQCHIPVGNFPMELCVPFRGFAKVFTCSRPLRTISSVTKYGGYSVSQLGAFRLLRFLQMLSLTVMAWLLIQELGNSSCGLYVSAQSFKGPQSSEVAFKFIDRICKRNTFIKTFISVKIAPHIGCNRRQERNVIII